MPEDERYKTVKHLIETGYITGFLQIFKHIPPSVVSNDFGIHYSRFMELIKDGKEFKLRELLVLSRFFDVDPKIFISMVVDHFLSTITTAPPDSQK